MASLVQKEPWEIRVLLAPRATVEWLETLAKTDVPALCVVLQVSPVPRARKETSETLVLSACSVPVEQKVRTAPTGRQVLLVLAAPREIKVPQALVELLVMLVLAEARETRETLVPLERKVSLEIVAPRVKLEKWDPLGVQAREDRSGSRERLVPSELLVAWDSRDPRETRAILVFLDLPDLSDPRDLQATKDLKATKAPQVPLDLVVSVE